MSIDFQLLKRLCEIPGAPAHEERIREAILATVKPYVDDCQVDNLGNLICLKRGNANTGKKVALAAHMDEISFMITHIEPEGFARFIPLGGFDPKTLISQRVLAHGTQDLMGVIAIKPIHLSSEEDAKKKVEIEHLVIDFGMPGSELSQFLRIGDPVTRIGPLEMLGHCFSGKSLDNRVSVYVLAEALRQFEGCPHDVYAAFTVQEEVGLRGAEVLARTVEPDFGIAIDTTIAYDLPSAKSYEAVTSLGKGVGVKLYDSGTIVDKRMFNYLRERCERHSIMWQPEILKRGGTDTAALQRAGRGGSLAGAISIPTRHIHTTVETVHKADVEASIRLTVKALAEMSDLALGLPNS